MREGVILKVENILVEGNTAAVEMKSLSTAKNGKPFNNTYCWIVVFDNNRMIKNVTAYVASALVQKVVDEMNDTFP